MTTSIGKHMVRSKMAQNTHKLAQIKSSFIRCKVFIWGCISVLVNTKIHVNVPSITRDRFLHSRRTDKILTTESNHLPLCGSSRYKNVMRNFVLSASCVLEEKKFSISPVKMRTRSFSLCNVKGKRRHTHSGSVGWMSMHFIFFILDRI